MRVYDRSSTASLILIPVIVSMTVTYFSIHKSKYRLVAPNSDSFVAIFMLMSA